MRFAPAVNDYCRILLLAKGDTKLHKLVVDALFKLREHVLQDQKCGVVIVDVMINVIRSGHFDRGIVDKLLSAYGMERLFSENACQKHKHVPALFKPLNNAIEAGKRVYTTRYAEIYLHIMSDALYNHFKQKLEEGRINEGVAEMINAIVNGESPLPAFLLNDEFNARIIELNGICAKPVSRNE